MRSYRSDDHRGNHNADLTPVCVSPKALKARLDKANGHIDAAGKKLWYETDRGFRLADWLLEPVEKFPLVLKQNLM